LRSFQSQSTGIVWVTKQNHHKSAGVTWDEVLGVISAVEYPVGVMAP